MQNKSGFFEKSFSGKVSDPPTEAMEKTLDEYFADYEKNHPEKFEGLSNEERKKVFDETKKNIEPLLLEKLKENLLKKAFDPHKSS